MEKLSTDFQFQRFGILKRFSISVREIIIGGAAAATVCLCVVFAGLYVASIHHHSKSTSESPTAARLSSKSSDSAKKPEICKDAICLESTAYLATNRNTSVDPCDNFFQYACGNWPNQHPLSPDISQNSVLRNIRRENEKKIRRILSSNKIRTVPWAAERKLKDMFKSCIDDYGRMVVNGNPFLTKVLNKTGGWYALGTWDQAKWNLTETLKKVHVDFWTDALFAVYVGTDWHYNSQRVISLHNGGLAMPPSIYTNILFNKVISDYRTFVRTVANLLIRDSGVTMDTATKEDRVNTYVEDVMFIETKLANISKNASPLYEAYELDERVSLRTLTQRSNGTINWTSFLTYMFDSAGVTANTVVVVHDKDYLNKTTYFLSHLGENGTRMIHNYFVWRLAYSYVRDLSYEYNHASRQFWADLTGETEFMGVWDYCYNYIRSTMKTALSSLFVKDHFADRNKEKVNEIVDYMKQAVIDDIPNLQWMDQKTKIYATDKMKKMLTNLGYADFMVDDDKVDVIYHPLAVNKQDYFQNVLNMNAFLKTDLNRQLNMRYERGKWRGNTYDTFAMYDFNWHELLVPAGMLQFPLYDYKLKHYINFGSMGSFIGHVIIHAVDEWGAHHMKDGSYDKDENGEWTQWWSAKTQQNYTRYRQCMVDHFANITAGPYRVGGRTYNLKIKADLYAPEGIAEIGGLRLAYNAFKSWEKQNGVETTLPHLSLTNDQMYFLSYAQTWCNVRTDANSYRRVNNGMVPEEIMVNEGLRQFDTFADVFKCKKDSPMTTNNQCRVF